MPVNSKEFIERQPLLDYLEKRKKICSRPVGEDLIDSVERHVREMPIADVIDRAKLCAKLMSEFNVVDIDEDDGEYILNDQWVSIIDVLDTIDGMRAEGTESIWGENGGGVNA